MAAAEREFVAGETQAGIRVDAAAAAAFGVSRSSLTGEFQTGRVRVNGNAAKARLILQAGDKVMWLPEQTKAAEPVVAPDLPIVYQDDDLLIIDKPAGLNVHPTEHGRIEPTVADFSAELVEDEDDERPGIVHRLDKDTSGLLVIAKNPAAKRHLQQQFQKRTVEKRYIALVRGRLEPPEATINLPISRDRKRPTRRAVVPGGRPSVTHYRVTHQYDGAALADVKLETGRTHQIRVHMAHLGHPVVGDGLYGAPDKKLGRQFLHAAELSLTGPSGKTIHVVSPLPADLRSYLDHLK